MISKKTIDEIYQQPVEKIIGRYTDLKKKGANLTGLCPFHNEKTPSFMVSPAKGIYKCFGCGKGGTSPISFLMEKESLPFKDAILQLAQLYNINVDYDDSEHGQKYKSHMEHCQRLASINTFAADVYVSYLHEAPKGAIRCSKEMAEKFHLGYAPAAFDLLIKEAHAKGVSTDQLTEVGLVKKKKNVYNVFRERVMFPIYNVNNMLTGFSGRTTLTDAAAKEQEVAKYMNTSETPLFIKGHELFGIHLAKQAIRKEKFAYLVEGNWDVVSMHARGLENTIAACGTALTDDHLKLLKRFCTHLVFVYDNDNAGRKALLDNTRKAIEQGFTCDCIILGEGSEKQDPDDFFRDDANFEKQGKKTIYEFTREMHVDALVHYAIIRRKRATSVGEKTESFTDIAQLLSYIDKDAMIREYAKLIFEATGIVAKDLSREAGRIKEDRLQESIDEDEIPIPKGVDREEFERDGFYELVEGKKTGYWFWAGGKEKFAKASNFVIRPLYHIYSKIDNKRLVEIDNGRSKSIVDMASKAMVGIQMFREIMFDEGNFRFDGNAGQFNKVMAKNSDKFPRAEELKTLGWQSEGFYAFADGIFNGSWVQVNSHGIIINKDKHFFLPAFSTIYADSREEDDHYENDRWFKYRYNAKANFEEWAKLMVLAYGNNGKLAIAFFIASVFRDMIYSKYKIFPHLFLFGEKGSGKSQLAWSLNNIFWNSQPGFNLTSGTNVGFFRKMARAKNAIVWYDEYNDYIDPKRFQALKSAYDGIGHEKGIMSRDNRTQITPINSACCISGQYLPTVDDNALFTRSILLSFKIDDWKGKEEIQKAYNEIKVMEEGGMSAIITDVIKYRDLMEDRYTANFSSEFARVKEELGDYNERILRNFVTIISAVKTLMNSLKLPFTYEELYDLTKKMVVEQSQQISESEALSQFWMMIEFLFRDKKINWSNNQAFNCDFMVLDKDSVRIMIDRKTEKIEEFPQTRKCLFIRFTKVHPLYMEMHRKQHGHNGIAMASLKTYIHSHKAFIGLTKSIQFEDGVSSAYVFDYNELGVNLEQTYASSHSALGSQTAPLETAAAPEVSNVGVQGEMNYEKPSEDLPF